MKASNATEYIRQQLFAGKSLTMQQVRKKFGSSKTATRIGEIEREYGVKVTRTPKKFRTSTGYAICNVYSLDCKKYAKMIKN